MSDKGRLPILTLGLWVRLKGTSEVPEWARGQDAVIVRAPTKNVEDEPSNYQTQDKDTKFLVRVRESSRELEVKRSAFEAVAVDQGNLVNVGGRGPAPEDMGPNVPPGELVYVGKDKWVDPNDPEDKPHKIEDED